MPAIQLAGGATLHLLSPTGPKLKKMATVWEEVVVAAGIVPGKGLALEGRKPPKRHKAVPPLPASLTPAALTTMSAGRPHDPSEANGASIAFLFEFDGKRALLGADAHADVLVSSLRRFGQAVGEERVKVDLFKLPHHASKHNVSTELIGMVDAVRYLVSSNGDNFGHPDDAAIARIILGSARQPATFYCNFRSDRTLPWHTASPAVARFELPKEGKVGLRVSASSR